MDTFSISIKVPQAGDKYFRPWRNVVYFFVFLLCLAIAVCVGHLLMALTTLSFVGKVPWVVVVNLFLLYLMVCGIIIRRRGVTDVLAPAIFVVMGPFIAMFVYVIALPIIDSGNVWMWLEIVLLTAVVIFVVSPRD